MGFYQDMRESLGQEGVQVTIQCVETSIPLEGKIQATIVLGGGNRSAEVEKITARIIEAHRQWRTQGGDVLSDEEASSHAERRTLSPEWTQKIMAESTVAVGQELLARGSRSLELELPLPPDSSISSLACITSLHIQADVKEQIDPTTTATLTIVQNAV